MNLKEIKARAAAATPGPWTVDSYGAIHGPDDSEEWAAIEVGTTAEWAEDDVRFVIHAREDLPALVAEVERLDAWLGKCLAALNKIGHLTAGVEDGLERQVYDLALATAYPGPDSPEAAALRARSST